MLISGSGSNDNRQRRTPREGGWDCTCGANNFANRTECFKCKESRPEGVGDGSRPKRSGGWDCTCGVNNFGNRSECFKCHEPRPAGAGDDGRPKRTGGWDCSCGVNNFASRTECFKCSEPRSGGAGTTNGDTKPKRPGNWECPCGSSNYVSRTSCFQCREDKPEGLPVFHDEKENTFYIPDVKDVAFNSGITSGINFDKYDHIPVKVTGENVPKPCTSFSDAGLEQFLQGNIKRCNYTKPTPIQKHAIPIILGGRDVMACAQTGSGKTAAFLLPIINTILTDNRPMSMGRPQVVIMSPTRELAIQVTRFLLETDE